MQLLRPLCTHTHTLYTLYTNTIVFLDDTSGPMGTAHFQKRPTLRPTLTPFFFSFKIVVVLFSLPFFPPILFNKTRRKKKKKVVQRFRVLDHCVTRAHSNPQQQLRVGSVDPLQRLLQDAISISKHEPSSSSFTPGWFQASPLLLPNKQSSR